jgi:type VI secretion system protein ImpM
MTVGFYGKIPATGDFVTWNLPRVFTDRWDRWMSMELRDRPDEGELDTRIWRFAIQAGIFGDQPCAGAWRMSQDRVGRRYPFAVVAIGATPAPEDPWFDQVASIVEAAIESFWPQGRLAEEIAKLPSPKEAPPSDQIVFWADDWELRELRFADIFDLADNGLPLMRAARAEPVQF